MISACLEDNLGINNIIKYRTEIQFLLRFIWRSVNPIETETGHVNVRLCSLFARFSVSTVGLEPSEKTTTNLPCNEHESSNRNQWIYKIPNKARQKLYFATILDEKKEDEDVCIALGE